MKKNVRMEPEGKLQERTEEVWSERPENPECLLSKEPRKIVVTGTGIGYEYRTNKAA